MVNQTQNAPAVEAERIKVLRVDASPRGVDSATRRVTDELLAALGDAAAITERDLVRHEPAYVDAAWVDANFTDAAERSAEQRFALAESNGLVAELRAADVLVVGAPVHNFGIPARLKGWIDLVARARETFRYTEHGPVGLLEGKRAVVIYAAGGTRLGSAVDFVSPYLRHVLGFLGIQDVTFVDAGASSAEVLTSVAAALREAPEARAA